MLNDEKAYAGYAEADAEGSGVVSLSGEKLAKAAGLARDNAGFSLF